MRSATRQATTEPRVCVNLMQLARVASQRLAEALAEAGLSGPAFALLDTLDRGGPASQLDVARRLGVHPSNVVRGLDQMEAAGLTARTRDPHDRRRQLVELTPAGRRKLAQARAIAHTVELELLDELNATERRRLEGLLGRVAEGCRSC